METKTFVFWGESDTYKFSANVLAYLFFLFFQGPKKVVKKLVRLQRNFLWGGASDQNKIAWVKWEAVCLPKEEGGLGVKDITSFNVALIGKWKWELFQSPGELWVRLINSKYGGWRGLNEDPRAAKESIWWRDLKKLCQHTQQGQLLNNSITWQVGCGNEAKFWEDSWTGGGNKLLEKYPRLYTISEQQNQLIQNMGNHKESGWEWDFKWRRSFFDNEIQMAVSFIQELEGTRIRPTTADQWVWDSDPTGQYSAKSAYKVLRQHVPTEVQGEEFKELWKLFE